MRTPLMVSLYSLAALLAWPSIVIAQQAGPAHTPPKTDEEKIANAISAAPEAVGRDATVVEVDDKGHMRTLRQGANNFTCVPDLPMTPGNDPQCADKNAMAWLEAWMAHKPPPAGKIGFIYMLQGSSDASNTDPYASEPEPGRKWVNTGPHIMVVNAGDMVSEYPSQKENPDTRQPYMMWSETPYEHLMIPVE